LLQRSTTERSDPRGKVQLLTESGETIMVEIRVVSEEDREYLELQKAFD